MVSYSPCREDSEIYNYIEEMRNILLTVFLLVAAASLHAKITPAPVIGDNMVLQQNAEVALWGFAEPDAKVTITTSWSKGKTVVSSDAGGKWQVRISTPSAGGPYEITISDGEKLTLKNILIGEVWICSGQSNMRMPMKGFYGQPVKGAAEYIVSARPERQIRLCRVKENRSFVPETTCKAQWKEHLPGAVAEISATAYFFARLLNESLNVPVGIIEAAWGGSPIEAWMDKEVLAKEFSDDFDLSFYMNGKYEGKHQHHAPGVIYNGMLCPIMPYTAKGFLWYQGCANRTQPDLYMRMQPAFAKMLRERWGNAQMPFYFAQIAPYGYDNRPEDPSAGLFMDAQARTLDMIPNSAMVATHDVGDRYTIHPPDKKTVGHRFAFLALARDYGISGVEPDSPRLKSVDYSPNTAVLTFNVSRLGLNPYLKDLPGFELAGDDKVFYPAVARISKDGMTVTVKCSEVPEPVAVRYGIHNYSEATVFNSSGIPISPFRTDNW